MGMRRAPFATALLLGACASGKRNEASVVVPPDQQLQQVLEEQGDDEGQLVRRTHQNVRRYDELLREGQMEPVAALRRTIARTVDEHFATFYKLALDRKADAMLRNGAVASLGFAVENRVPARKLLESLLRERADPEWVLANACQGLGVLADRETDLSVVIPFVSHGQVELRVSAATAIKDVWRVAETPRDLTPQHYAAIDRLVALLHDRATTRGRRAAAWALANLRHPAVLDHLLAALEDGDDLVQIGGLYGIEKLGDARALERLFDYLERDPSDAAATWAAKALQTIAVQNGFAQTRGELESLGTDGKSWRKWFRARRAK